MAGPGRRGRALAQECRSLGAVGLLLLLSATLPSVTAAHPTGETPGAPGPAAGCGGAGLPTAYTGSLGVEGGGLTPPSVANRSISVQYWATLNFTPKGGASNYTCKPETATATTDPLGGFSMALPIPTSTCNSVSCSIYAGPFGPARFSLPGGTPAGYFLTQSLSGSQAGLDLVNALASTRLVPGSRVTLSTNAPTVVHAFPLAGNGAPSPASVTFAWRLAGAGWSLLGGSASANVTIEAQDGAVPGTLTAWVNGSFNGTALAAPSITLGLAASNTTVSGTSESATAIDVGFPVTVTVTGQGAGGYAYWANFTPGLNASPVRAGCTGTDVAGGLLALTCSASVTFPFPGTSVPTVLLTNGYSGASRTLLPIAVAPGLDFSLNAIAFRAYAGAAVSISVTADPSAGTAPRGPACVWPGDGRTVCDAGPGPSYGFSFAYGSPGDFAGHATLADAAGGNASAPFTATVSDRPSLFGLRTSSNLVAVGQNATLVGVVVGGALPITYWWNSSAPSGTLYEGSTSLDGPIVLTFAPRVAALTTITLTVLDALGTALSASTRMNVSAGPASAVRFEGPANGTGTAGVPVAFSWTAIDPGGETVPGWAAEATLTIGEVSGGAAGGPAAGVNLSGGPVPAAPNGTYPIPASAWSLGTLRASIVLDRAGAYDIQLRDGLPLANGTSTAPFVIVPNLARLALSAPVVQVAGARTNHTLWHVADVYGNAAPGGAIDVATDVNGATSVVRSPIRGGPANGTTVWVNYSVPDGVAATVTVLSLAGEALLPPIYLAGPASGTTVPVAWLFGALLVAGAAAGALTLLGRRRLSDPPMPPGPEPPVGEEELERWAEGRAHVLHRASIERGLTVDELAQGFVGRPPRPEEMTEWIASLVADGSLRTVLGDDGRSRFLKVREDDAPPRVTLDDRALSEAIRRREALDAGIDEGSGDR